MEIPGSTHHYISADKLSVLHASWHKSKNLSIYCPLHCSGQLNPDHLAHIVCCQDDNSTNLFVLGWIMAFSEHTKFWVFHVIRKNESARVVEHTDFVALPEEISIFEPLFCLYLCNLSERTCQSV